jgi:Replication-relaxation
MMQERNEKILLSLKKLGFIERNQIQLIHNIGSVRTTQRVMQQLKPYVSSFRDERTIYYLNSEGRRMVDSKKALKKSTTANHYILRNYLYIAFECPSEWKNEVRLKYKDVNVIADAYFKRGENVHIIEVDHTQKMNVNQKKIEKYRKLLDYGALPASTLLTWITTTEYRRQRLDAMCEGMRVQVFTASDFQ